MLWKLASYLLTNCSDVLLCFAFISIFYMTVLFSGLCACRLNASSDPALFPAMSSSILDLLANCSHLALSSIEDDSPQADGLRAITAFAQETIIKDSSK